MKKGIAILWGSVALLASVANAYADSFGPSREQQKCPDGQVAICTMGACVTYAVYRPIQYRCTDAGCEPISSPSSDTQCDWSCVCSGDKLEALN